MLSLCGGKRKGGPTTGEGEMGIGRGIGGPRDRQRLQKLRQFITLLCAGLHLIGPTASIPALGSRPSCARASPLLTSALSRPSTVLLYTLL